MPNTLNNKNREDYNNLIDENLNSKQHDFENHSHDHRNEEAHEHVHNLNQEHNYEHDHSHDHIRHHGHENGCSCEDHLHHHNHEHDHEHHHHEGDDCSDDHCCAACAARAKTTLTPVKSSLLDTERIVDLIRIFAAAILLVCGYVFNMDVLFFAGYIIVGYEVIWEALKSLFRGEALDEHFLMFISTIGAMYVGQHPEATGVMLFYSIGEFFEDIAVDRSRRSIAMAMDIKSDSATKKVGEELIDVKPEDLKIGDIILVKPGEKIPVDGKILTGISTLDTAALTGESIPRDAEPGDNITSGFINGNGLLEIEVTAEFRDSAVGKILEMVESSSARKTHMEKFITKFAKYYTPIVVVLAVLLAILPPAFTGWNNFNDWLYRAMTFLVISCPCALVISVPMSLFAGIGAASSKGMVVKGSSYLEAFARLGTIAFDKTGTLTRGVFAVDSVRPAKGVTEANLVAAAYSCEHLSKHPIATAISDYAKKVLSATDQQSLFHDITKYEEIPGHGTKAINTTKIFYAGNIKLMKKIGLEDSILNTSNNADETETGSSLVYIAEASQNETNPKFLGTIEVSDQIRSESAETISKLRNLGVRRVMMLTGDRESVASSVAKEIGLTDYRAQLLPQDKVKTMSEFIQERNAKKQREAIAFVGDGINDAPVLAISDVGVAMGAFGSDAAVEAADVVMMTDSIAKLPLLISIAKKTVRISKENIIFAIGIKLIFLALGALGMANLWMAVFADVGVTVLAILNAMRSLKVDEQ
ncbi:MAG: heavy metal translocating P-type ATPase [Anaerovoracaceae bacterium]|nr:heavy metal translocating P-type ATPase [Anaerovoracaceae bacterium]